MREANLPSVSCSCIIPTFNRQDPLRQALDFIQRQRGVDLQQVEVLVVDDGSVDQTAGMIEVLMIEKRYPYVLRYFNTGLTTLFGASVARNLGIRNARAPYLVFLDDDCLPHPDWLASLMRAFVAGEKVVVGNITHDQRRLSHADATRIDHPRILAMKEKAEQGDLSELASANFAVFADCFKQAGLFDERFARKDGYGYEDIELGHRLLMAGYQLAFCPEALVYTPEPKAEEFLRNEALRQRAKQRWWEIIQSPQEHLPITPQLKIYAKQKAEELHRKVKK